jgi:hypothetical protein
MNYLENAKQTLSKSLIEYGTIYSDSKYVREASGIAYLSAPPFTCGAEIYFSVSRGIINTGILDS